MSVEHDYFGLIGDYWSETVPAGDQDVEVVLDADVDLVSTDALDIAAALIGDLEDVDDAVREGFVSELSSSASPTSHYLAVLAESLDAETIGDEIVRASGDQQIDILRSLVLRRVDIRPENDGDEEPFAVFEYAFAEYETDARLVASVDVHRDLVAVECQA